MKIKVCGMKYADNILDVAALRPDFMGFIFYPQSKRYVGEDFMLPSIPSGIKKTGVFVNDSAGRVMDKIKKYNLDFVQLHGDESAEYCKNIARASKVIKAFGIDEQFDFSVLSVYKDVCDYFLFDTKTDSYGGSGRRFNPAILKSYDLDKPFFLSGGLDLNIAISSNIHPMLYAIDVNSKFEDKPALKNINKLKQLIDELSGK